MSSTVFTLSVILQFRTYRINSRKESCIKAYTRELIKFSYVQSIYFIYTGLIVCAILNLAYSKEYVFILRSIYIIHAV